MGSVNNKSKPKDAPGGTLESVRLDVWLNVACLFKTRSQAKTACENRQVSVNGQTVKPHHKLQVDDEIEFIRADWPRVLLVKGLRSKPIAKAEARLLYEDVSPPRPKMDLIDRILKGPPVVREKGTGRPTKKERRAIEKLQE